MAGAGDYGTYRRQNQRADGDLTLLATDTPTTVGAALLPLKVGYTLYVQWISVTVTTDAAQPLTFQDSAGTPVKIATIPASPGVVQKLFDYGAAGTPLTVSKALDLIGAVAGLAAKIHVEGYYKQTGVLAAQIAGQNNMT